MSSDIVTPILKRESFSDIISLTVSKKTDRQMIKGHIYDPGYGLESDDWKRDTAMKVVLDHLTKRFPSRSKKGEDVIAVNDFTFEIPDGQLIGLLGPSGCGKSTTLNLICGLETPTEGRIFFGEDDVTHLPPESRGVGLVFQNYALYPHLTVLQNILFPLQNLKGEARPSKEEMRRRAEEAARLVQIDMLLDRRPAELSGGQQQRVAIARAMATKPEIIYFDEPTSALDPELIGEVLAVMRKLAEDGMTMLVVTHEMDFARNVSSKVMFMEGGKVIETAPSKQFFEAPAEPRVREFIRKIQNS